MKEISSFLADLVLILMDLVFLYILIRECHKD